MAFIGMRHVVGAVLTAHTAGSEPTYGSSGSGFDIGKAISGNLTIDRNNNPLYADDAIAEDDTGATGMSLEIGVDDLDEDTQASMGLLKKVTTGTGTTVDTYYENTASSKPMGVGYMRIRRKNGTTKYQGVWYYKILFARNSENTQTRSESIDWQTPTINGRCVPLAIDSSGENTFRKIQNFDTESAAATWLDGLANVSRT